MHNKIVRPTEPRLYFNAAEAQWYVEVEMPLPAQALRNIAKWGYKVNLDRWRGLSAGDRRESLGNALKKLQTADIKQVIRKKEFEIGFD